MRESKAGHVSDLRHINFEHQAKTHFNLQRMQVIRIYPMQLCQLRRENYAVLSDSGK